MLHFVWPNRNSNHRLFDKRSATPAIPELHDLHHVSARIQFSRLHCYDQDKLIQRAKLLNQLATQGCFAGFTKVTPLLWVLPQQILRCLKNNPTDICNAVKTT